MILIAATLSVNLLLAYVRKETGMPRKQRLRRIRGYPDYWSFSPDDAETISNSVVMSLDEYETIRLIDKEKLSQEQCAQQMGVARTTVTSIYESARRKIAETIVDGKQLLISGGQYQLPEYEIKRKETDTMRIAVTYENGEVFQHFGHTEKFRHTMCRMIRSSQRKLSPPQGVGTAPLPVS